MPEPRVYEDEYFYWPWGKVISYVAEWLIKEMPAGTRVLDYMCGTGFLLSVVSGKRPDLQLEGCSLDEEYVEYGRRKYQGLSLTYQDCMDYRPSAPLNTIVCTGGLHHLSRDLQPQFVRKVASELLEGGVFIIGEEVINTFSSENERLSAVLQLGCGLMKHLIATSAPKEMLAAAVEVFANDIQEFEFKLDMVRMYELLKRDFRIRRVVHVWPDPAEGYGDVVLICERV